MPITPDEFKKIQAALRTVVQDELQPQLAALRQDFATSQRGVDAFVKGLAAYHDEFVVYKAQQQRLKDVLVRKGVVSERELAV